MIQSFEIYRKSSFSSLPKISYMKALDFYLAVCFFMVFGALLEYATVSYAGKRIKLNVKRFEEFEKKLKEIKSRSKNELPLLSTENHHWSSHHADTCPVKIKQIQIMNFEPSHHLYPSMAVSLEKQQLSQEPPTTLYGWRPSDLERWARIVFPVFFFTFHVFYWTILINISDVKIEGLMPLKQKV